MALIASTVGSVIYARGQQDEAVKVHELEQDNRITNTAASFAAHRRDAAKVALENATKIRNMGALQIEQGNDQRAILLDSAPKKVAEKRKTKPVALQSAEAAVRRD